MSLKQLEVKGSVKQREKESVKLWRKQEGERKERDTPGREKIELMMFSFCSDFIW